MASTHQSRNSHIAPGPDPEELSRVIGLIYDCAVDAGLWPKALESMCRLVEAKLGTISLLDPNRREIRFASHWGSDPDWPHWVKLLDEKYASMMPFYEVFSKTEIGLCENTESWSRLLDQPGFNFYETPFFKEWAEPAGLRDAVGSTLIMTQDRVCFLAMHTPLANDLVGPHQLAIGNLLTPHVRRAVLIGDLIEMRTLESATLKSTLDLISVPVLLTDAEAQVVHANSAGRRMIDAGDPIIETNGRLELTVDTGIVLEDVIRHAAVNHAAPDAPSLSVPAPFADGRPGLAHVLPLTVPPVRSRLDPRARAAVFVGTPDAPLTSIKGLDALFGLTETESRVLASILAGRNQAETAAHLGIGDGTVKTHLRRIFSKTGTANQAELARLSDRLAVRTVTKP